MFQDLENDASKEEVQAQLSCGVTTLRCCFGQSVALDPTLARPDDGHAHAKVHDPGLLASKKRDYRPKSPSDFGRGYPTLAL